MNKNIIHSQARLAYLLSSCHMLFHVIFKNIINQYKGQNVVSIRSCFDIYIRFDNNSNVFTLDRLSSKFMNLSDDAVNKLFSPCIKPGYKNNIHNCIIFHIIKLIWKFKNHKYIMIPITIDYGISGAMYHQAMLIINIQDKIFMFYEPYGKYSKFDMSYKDVILDAFKDDILNSYTYVTYHDFYNIQTGIQSLLLEQNNKKQDFEDKFILIKNKYNYEDYLRDPTDLTVKCLYLLHEAELNILNNDTYIKALELYYNYNSKTCVSITLVEMAHFLNNTHMELYNKISNESLMKEIYELTIKFAKSNKIVTYLSDTTIDSKFLCNHIFI